MFEPLTPHIAKYHLSTDITPDDINFLLQFLSSDELYRVTKYENSLRDNLTSKRLFLFICNLIDMRNIKLKNKRRKFKKYFVK